MRARRRTRLCLALAFASSIISGAWAAGSLRASPAELRTFEVTVSGDDTPQQGTAKATLFSRDTKTATYLLTRTVPGRSSEYVSGTAIVNLATHAIRVRFSKARPAPTSGQPAVALGGRTGMTRVLAEPDHAPSAAPATAIEGVATPTKKLDGPEGVAVTLAPTKPDDYVFEGTWTANGYHFHEEWRELTHLTAGIEILSPKADQDYLEGNIDFHAVVKSADHVEFLIDGVKIASFQGAGDHEVRRGVWLPGSRRFTVKAFGPPTASNPKGALIGSSDVIFDVSGLTLLPADGARVKGSVTRVQATPIEIPDLGSIKFLLDGKKVATVTHGPWGIDLHFGSAGRHTLAAVACDSKGQEVVRAVSRIMVEKGEPVPAPPKHDSDLPGFKGEPDIDSSAPRANANNFSHRVTKKTMIIIHKVEGTLSSAVGWFHDPRARTSAHYVVDDRRIVQCVDDENVCWHTGNSAWNRFSIGIENSGFTDRDDMTEAHYERLAGLVAFLCKKHGIPADRGHIKGHDEVPDPGHPGRFGGSNNHEDPGRFFDWTKLMRYVQQASR